MVDTDAAGPKRMRCAIQGCSGSYEARSITHTVRHRGDIVVIDHVPAEVCGVCGDVLLSPDTVRHLETILEGRSAPDKTAPLYEFAKSA